MGGQRAGRKPLLSRGPPPAELVLGQSSDAQPAPRPQEAAQRAAPAVIHGPRACAVSAGAIVDTRVTVKQRPAGVRS